MNTMTRRAAALVAGLLLCAGASVCSADQTIDGTLDATSYTGKRVKNTGSTVSPECAALADLSYNDHVRFKQYGIVLAEDGVFSAVVTTTKPPVFDTLLALYCEPFSPLDPQDNLIAIDDDGAGYPDPALLNVNLAAGIYYLVIASYSNYSSDVVSPVGDYRIEITGNAESFEETLISLVSFSAQPGRNSVTLTWETAAEISNAGFNLYRARSENGSYVRVNKDLIPAQGSPFEGMSYSFVDQWLLNGRTYYYILEDVDLDGVATEHGPVSAQPRFFAR